MFSTQINLSLIAATTGRLGSLRLLDATRNLSSRLNKSGTTDCHEQFTVHDTGRHRRI